MKSSAVSSFPITLLLVYHTLQSCSASSDPVSNQIREALRSIQGWQKDDSEARLVTPSKFNRPFVTLTFAQSLDGKIATLRDNGVSSNFALSGKDSLVFTHALRSTHDGILIGGTTLEIDNPRLTNRMWGDKQPRPIVLDTHLTRIQALGNNCRLQNPIICCSSESAASLESLPQNVQILQCKCTSAGVLDIEDVLYQLWSNCGIRSLLVEGGAAVLSCFLEQDHLFDALCVTIAPKLLGTAGIGPTFPGKPKELGPDARFLTLGVDSVLISPYSGGR